MKKLLLMIALLIGVMVCQAGNKDENPPGKSIYLTELPSVDFQITNPVIVTDFVENVPIIWYYVPVTLLNVTFGILTAEEQILMTNDASFSSNQMVYLPKQQIASGGMVDWQGLRVDNSLKITDQLWLRDSDIRLC
jgi:hypothetical protein